MNDKNGKPLLAIDFGTLVSFIAMVLLLIGIFGAIRTGINLLTFKRYPTTGVLTVNPSGYTTLSSREEDCQPVGTQTYYNDKNMPREATKEEVANEKRNFDNCVSSVVEMRESTKVNDIGLSLAFLILGGGLFLFRRFLPH